MDKTIVIIVTYNAGKWIQTCLTTLSYSTINVNIIVIDNASKDDSVSIIQENFPDVELIINKRNLGFGKANNIGLKKAIEHDFDFILLLNQDAWVKPNTIELLINCLKKNKEYGILSPIHLNGKEDKLDELFYTHLTNSKYSREIITDFIQKDIKQLYEIEFVNAAFWLISKNCLINIGGFNPIFAHYGEDNEYLNRLKYHGYKIGIVTNSFCIHDREGRKDKLRERFQKNKIMYQVNVTDINIPAITIQEQKKTYQLNLIKHIIKQLIYFKFKESYSYFKYYSDIKELYKVAFDSRKFTSLKGEIFLKTENE